MRLFWNRSAAFCHHLRFVLFLIPFSLTLNFDLTASMETRSFEQTLDSALAICRGRVIRQTVYRDPDNLRIYTCSRIAVDEALKGTFPKEITVTHRGGILKGEGLVDSAAPKFHNGTEHLFLLGRRSDGSLFCFGGSGGSPLLKHTETSNRKSYIPTFDQRSESLLEQIRKRFPNPGTSGLDLTSFDRPVPETSSDPRAVAVLATDNSGVSRRFTAGDRGEPIEYLVDADALPPGITLDQALGAVRTAFDAWSVATTLTFSFAGVESFGRGVGNLQIADGKIRIQLHDLHQDIQDPGQLGVGGNDFLISSAFPNGGMGGNVAGAEFFPVTQGFVTLKHTHAAMSDLKTLEEVLSHEIGHVLSLQHSSEDSSETDPLLREALMFKNAHEDGRGARLDAYDVNAVQSAYPKLNTPPFGYDRVLQVVTTPGPEPTISAINQVEFSVYDLQTTALTLDLVLQDGVGAGDFALNGKTLRFTPSGFFSAPPLDPASQSYGLAFLRISDGTNRSPYNVVKVMSLQTDQSPRNAPDGLPDDWVAQYYGDPSAPVDPQSDDDGDGITNLNEFLSGTNPKDPNDALRISSVNSGRLEWPSHQYDLYEIHGTRDFRNWFRIGNPVSAGTTSASFSLSHASIEAPLFFRLVRLP